VSTPESPTPPPAIVLPPADDARVVAAGRLNDLIAQKDAALARAAAAEAVAAEAVSLKARLAQVEARAAQTEALLGLAAEHPAFKQPTVRARVMREYEQAHDGVPAEQRPKFDAWVAGLKDDPFWAPHFASSNAPPPTPAPSAFTLPVPPQVNAGAGGGTPPQRATEEAIRQALAAGRYDLVADQDLEAAIAAGEVLPMRKPKKA
jgi:hypothetical protein